jgi:glycosyltransferase involved in cell wall biosynthesis
MPIPDNSWTRGKCSFKAIQYMALGAPAVVSPVGMATDVVRHGVTGFLANTEKEWFDALECLVTNEATWKRMSLAARRSVEEEYSLQVWGDRFRCILDGVIGIDSPAETKIAIHS